MAAPVGTTAKANPIQLRVCNPAAKKISSNPKYDGCRTMPYNPLRLMFCDSWMATFELNDFPRATIAVHRITSPVTITITLVVFSQCAPPNMVQGPVSPIHCDTIIALTITIHKISSEPRSRTFPLLCFVRVVTSTTTSEATQPQ